MSIDMVNHPPHYKRYSIECIEITEHLSFCLGNAVKYIYRAGEKGDAVEDFKKAIWYLNRAELNGEDFSDFPRAEKNLSILLQDMLDQHNEDITIFLKELEQADDRDEFMENNPAPLLNAFKCMALEALLDSIAEGKTICEQYLA